MGAAHSFNVSGYDFCDEGGGGLRRVTRAHAVIRLASRVLAYRRGEPFGNGQAKGFVWAIAIFGLEKGSGGFA